MTEAHAWGALASLAMFAALTALGVAAATSGRLERAVEWARRGAIGTALLTAILGALLFASGARPAETLHALYGVVLVGVPAVAASFAAEAPPTARAGVLSVAGLIGLVLVWRLFATG